ncbi:MAG: hypothetical protein ISR61_05975 [Desulfobacteraceae bacterium]|uniref:Uncharacterized protein n=1 Tax=Candidatus Desulfacyla euxinica TaxID=2841693 RepID=A0A8J6T9U9_9DELT|nr:hypothetical protein [Candidatus Desulfacyla euxinica]MBL6978479.1 hypothetical protein [Desulfobacteraceae bacterium]MBL7217287.1 hypothetical protein [Desulfobacteraceae bacterium]
MKPLSEDLQTPKQNLDEFADITKRVLDYLPNIVSERVATRDYTILSSVVAGTTKFARPINNILFINKIEEFEKNYKSFLEILRQIKNRKKIKRKDYSTIDAVAYTIQQSIGVGMDFLCNPNSARKHVGNRFEELIRNIFSQAGVTNDKVVFKIPYPSEEGDKYYSCETDIILSPHERVKSNTKTINEDEIVISLKTTSKDRMGKIFLDKLLMQKFAEHPVKVVGIFLNDVQRKNTDKISYTFVSGLFMVYTKFLIQLEGVYFIDPPPITKTAPYNEHISPFSQFIANDIWEVLSP